MASFIGGVYTTGDTSGGIYYNPKLGGDTYIDDDGYHKPVGDWETLPEEGFAVGESFVPTPEPSPPPPIDFTTGEEIVDPDNPPTPPAAAAGSISPILIGLIVLAVAT